jgi:Cytochrome c554 and c-prime
VSERSAVIWPSSARSLISVSCAAIAAVLLCVFPASIPVIAQHAKPSNAPVTCATCHNGVATSYATAPMRHAMEPQGTNPVLAAHTDLSLQLGSYTYKVQTKDGQSTYTVSDGTDSLTLPIRWIFGQHAQTWVLEKDGHYYESLVSYFPRANGLAITPGDQKITPHNLTEAMGRQLPIWETRTCFNCHGGGVTANEKLAPTKVTPGLDCERCHVGAQQHMADAAQDNFKTVPKSLKRLDSEQVSDFCGQCHRTWDTVMHNKWRGPAFVRFQPYRLENSKCFIGNDSRISCLACHNPHQPVNHNVTYYDAKCLACHSDAKPASTASPTKTCPVSKSNCTSCHMPKVDLPSGHVQFTDHYIRVVHAGEPYPE